MAANDQTSRKTGRATGILLIPGIDTTPEQIRQLATDFSSQSCTVLSPTLQHASCTGQNLSRQTWPADGLESLEELVATCETVILAAHSTGALLSLELAATHPGKIDAIVLIAPVIDGASARSSWLARSLAAALFKTIATIISVPERRRHAMWNARRRLPDVLQPVLIVAPRQNNPATFDDAWLLQKDLPGTVELVVTGTSDQQSNHNLLGDTELDRTSSFIERVTTKITKPVQRTKPILAHSAVTGSSRDLAAVQPAAA